MTHCSRRHSRCHLRLSMAAVKLSGPAVTAADTVTASLGAWLLLPPPPAVLGRADLALLMLLPAVEADQGRCAPPLPLLVLRCWWWWEWYGDWSPAPPATSLLQLLPLLMIPPAAAVDVQLLLPPSSPSAAAAADSAEGPAFACSPAAAMHTVLLGAPAGHTPCPAAAPASSSGPQQANPLAAWLLGRSRL